MAIKYIICHTGYAESHSTAAMVYQCGFFGHPGYESVREAWLEFTKDIYAKYWSEVQSVRIPATQGCKGCNYASIVGSGGDHERHKVCKECHKELKDRPFSADEFKNYFIDLTHTNCDTYGDTEDSYTRECFAWWPFGHEHIGAPREEFLFVSEYAEVALLEALFELHPELKTNKDVTRIDYSCWEEINQDINPGLRK